MEIGFLAANTLLLRLIRVDNILLVLCYSGKVHDGAQFPTDLHIHQGKGKSTKEVLKRIDYGGSLSLLLTVRLIVRFLQPLLTF